jgi:hypothetical protein
LIEADISLKCGIIKIKESDNRRKTIKIKRNKRRINIMGNSESYVEQE